MYRNASLHEVLIHIWIVHTQAAHGSEIVGKVTRVVEMVIGEAPWYHSSDAHKVVLKISFPGCTDKAEDNLNHIHI